MSTLQLILFLVWFCIALAAGAALYGAWQWLYVNGQQPLSFIAYICRIAAKPLIQLQRPKLKTGLAPSSPSISTAEQ